MLLQYLRSIPLLNRISNRRKEWLLHGQRRHIERDETTCLKNKSSFVIFPEPLLYRYHHDYFAFSLDSCIVSIFGCYVPFAQILQQDVLLFNLRNESSSYKGGKNNLGESYTENLAQRLNKLPN